jgi:flap endonuclease-1
LGITREQLVIIGLLIGTDYNEGVEKIGPKTALKMITEHKTLEGVLEHVNWNEEIEPQKIYDFFLNPPVTEDYTIQFKEPDKNEIIRLMVDEHNFSLERIEKVVERLQSQKDRQVSLKGWFGK